jgi:hypothetical protein
MRPYEFGVPFTAISFILVRYLASRSDECCGYDQLVSRSLELITFAKSIHYFVLQL